MPRRRSRPSKYGGGVAARILWQERRDWFFREWKKMVGWLEAWHRAHPGLEQWYPAEPQRYGHEIPDDWNLDRHMREAAAKFLAGDFRTLRDKPPYGIGKFIRRSRTDIGVRSR